VILASLVLVWAGSSLILAVSASGLLSQLASTTNTPAMEQQQQSSSTTSSTTSATSEPGQQQTVAGEAQRELAGEPKSGDQTASEQSAGAMMGGRPIAAGPFQVAQSQSAGQNTQQALKLPKINIYINKSEIRKLLGE